MIKGFCIIISAVVVAAMAAGAANDYQAFRLEAQAGIPIPTCANVSLLRPPCR
jgi:hypothetical protein